MSIVLSDNEAETIMKALLNAQHEFNFLHGLRVTDVPDVRVTWELDCSQADMLVSDAISILDKFCLGGYVRD